MNKNIRQNKNQITASNHKIRVVKELEDGLNPLVLTKQVVIKGENKHIFIDFVNKIREKMPIYSKIEEEFLKTYIFSSWKLRRLREIEKNHLNYQQRIEMSGFYSREEISKMPKRRVRNLSQICMDDWIKENNIGQDKLKKDMAKALKQLREEQGLLAK